MRIVEALHWRPNQSKSGNEGTLLATGLLRSSRPARGSVSEVVELLGGEPCEGKAQSE